MGAGVWTMVIVFLAVALVVALLSAVAGGNKKENTYKQADLMTANEKEFFERLLKALPEHYVFPQVSLGALLRPAVSRSSPDWMRQFNAISSQRADFAIYTRQLQLVALIELDDKTHKASKDRARDRRTASAGISTLRYESKAKPEPEAIRRDIQLLAGATRTQETLSNVVNWAKRAGGRSKEGA